MKLETKYALRQKVWITELRCAATVVGIYLDGDGLQCQCRWFINGEQKTGYLLEDDLQEFNGPTPPGFVRIEMPLSLSAPELS